MLFFFCCIALQFSTKQQTHHIPITLLHLWQPSLEEKPHRRVSLAYPVAYRHRAKTVYKHGNHWDIVVGLRSMLLLATLAHHFSRLHTFLATWTWTTVFALANDSGFLLFSPFYYSRARLFSSVSFYRPFVGTQPSLPSEWQHRGMANGTAWHCSLISHSLPFWICSFHIWKTLYILFQTKHSFIFSFGIFYLLRKLLVGCFFNLLLILWEGAALKCGIKDYVVMLTRTSLAMAFVHYFRHSSFFDDTFVSWYFLLHTLHFLIEKLMKKYFFLLNILIFELLKIKIRVNPSRPKGILKYTKAKVGFNFCRSFFRL